MQDLAAEYTTCEIVRNNRLGAWTLPGVVTPQRRLPVGVLMDYVEGLGTTRQEKDAYATEIFTKWVAEDPYRRQVCSLHRCECPLASSRMKILLDQCNKKKVKIIH